MKFKKIIFLILISLMSSFFISSGNVFADKSTSTVGITFTEEDQIPSQKQPEDELELLNKEKENMNLPQTGEQNKTNFFAIGSIVIVCSSIYYIIRRRR